MYIVTRERELARARALSGALAIADLAGWQIDRSVPILPMPFRNYLHIATAELLLVPSIEPSRGDLDTVERGTRIARCDALVVKASSEGNNTLYCAVGEWQRHGTLWHHARRLWLSSRNEAWLVPDPDEPEESDAVFRLTGSRLRPMVPARLPATGAGAGAGRNFAPGLARGDAYVAAAWSQR
ncbi:hypothetical protein [Sphingomonas sp. Leaf205]|uniref:hypothetical protein n=1 Tax=Sphingomonas sp. Leaf205 TaxID=2876551 RepID=UPI001E42A335|nr:hypothetical protein [Sphingomonas sp. Leaf205]